MSREKRLRIEIILILLATAIWAAITGIPMALFTLAGGIATALILILLALLLSMGYPLALYGRVNLSFSFKDWLWKGD